MVSPFERRSEPRRKSMKKRTIRLLRGGLWLLLCAALTLCALSLRSEAPPREDVDAASRMLVSSSELLYGADSTSQIDSSSLSGEAEEPPPPEQPEPPQETPPEQTDAPAEAPPQDVPSDDSGIGDLMDIGSSGGGSGGQLPPPPRRGTGQCRGRRPGSLLRDQHHRRRRGGLRTLHLHHPPSEAGASGAGAHRHPERSVPRL